MHWNKLALIVLFLSGCATTQAPQVSSTVVPTDNITEVRDSIVGLCAQTGGTVHDASRNIVNCSREFDGSASNLIYRALLTEQYASNPENYLNFTLYKRSGGIGVTLREWVEHQNAWGKTTKNYLTGKKTLANHQVILDRLKSDFSTGLATELNNRHQVTIKPGNNPMSGKNSFSAKKIASSAGCSDTEIMSIEPPIELYKTHCSGGVIKIVSCEWSNCKLMQ